VALGGIVALAAVSASPTTAVAHPKPLTFQRLATVFLRLGRLF